MSIRENVSRVLFFGLLLAMLIVPVGYAITSTQVASRDDTKFTLFHTEDSSQPIAAIACDSDETASGGCGG